MRPFGPLLVLLLVPWGPARAAESEIVIGVVSPTGGGRAIGKAHEETVRFAFDRLGRTIEIDGRAVPLRVEYRSDGGDEARAVEVTRELVADGAIAIVGPVDSRSTKAVLDAGLEVPVLAALATSPSLSQPRDKWFFRLTLGDDERMWQFARTLYRYDGMMMEPRLMLFDDGNPYGEGLRDALMTEVSLDASSVVPWSELVAGGHVDDANRAAVSDGIGFTPEFQARLATPPRTVFVLGPNRGATPIARGIDEVLRARGSTPAQYYFVGADADLRNGAPAGSYAVGEPTIVDGNGSEAGKVRDEFAHDRRLDQDSFVVTAYEAAYYVLPRAIAAAARSSTAHDSTARANGELPEPAQLRARLREQLETLEFDSLEPWRRIRLHGGVMDGAPNVPVLRIARRFELVEVPVPRPWLEVDAPPGIGFLEGPVTVRLRGHNVPGDVALSIMRGAVEPYYAVSTETRSLKPDGWEGLTFYPFWPGQYRLQAKNLPTSPAASMIVVAPHFGYVFALGGAILGAALFIFAVTERGGRVSYRRTALGVVAGVALAGLTLNRDLLPTGVPIPTFPDSPHLTALWAGFAGGWFGPGVLLLLIPRLLTGWGKPPEGEDGTNHQSPQEPPHALTGT